MERKPQILLNSESDWTKVFVAFNGSMPLYVLSAFDVALSA